MANLEDLNPPQRVAVQAHQGPVLVLAGAGSGKTRVITYRIAFLLQERLARPWEILAMTFTNKAAAEMRGRVHALLGRNTQELFLGTFHAFGARLLRKHADAFGRNSRFTIYDDEDQSRLIRSMLKQGWGEERGSSYFQAAKKFIAKAKSSLKKPEVAAAEINRPLGNVLLDVFYKYETALKNSNAFDFDDLVSLPCQLLRQSVQLREEYRQRFRYLLIDEFQDTNFPQGELARLFAAPDGNVTAVGDDDQSIYGWRGAVIENILQFERDYQGVRTFRLEQNYRSTQAILDAAHQVIQKNRSRHPKRLWTSRVGGEKPRVLAMSDDREEALRVIERIQALLNSELKYSPGDMVILYRTNAQSRLFEEVLRKSRLPYVIVGGLRFYERKEVKDFLAYLRLLVNPSDLISLQRVINLPPRGIGDKTMQRLTAYAVEGKISLFEAIMRAGEIEDLSQRTAHKVTDFGRWIEALQKFAPGETLHSIGEKLLLESELLDYYQKDGAVEFENRKENLSELLNALREYSFESRRNGLEDLESFLQDVALVTDIDRWNPQERVVTLMTLHAAKGLEFPVVFMTGLEDGLFPLQNSISDPEVLEEERRLFYVGATRAKDLLFLTYARNRMRWGQEVSWQKPSRFLREIPDEYLEQERSLAPTPQEEERTDLFRKSRRPGDLRRKEHRPLREISYSIGSRVKHHLFGEGMVIKTEGQGKGLRVLVNFEEVGEKLLLAEIAKLQMVFEQHEA